MLVLSRRGHIHRFAFLAHLRLLLTCALTLASSSNSFVNTPRIKYDRLPIH